MRINRSLLLTIHLFTLAGYSASTEAVNEVEYELDPYYSNIGYYISLTEEAIPEVTYEREKTIYESMIYNAISTPRFFLVEASLNPLPVLGTYIKRNHPGFYDSSQFNEELNIIQAMTEGFEEPYALSFFLGSVVRFIRPGESEKVKNKGYTGYLLSIGDKHIVRNTLIDDNWYEFEFKIKGDQEFRKKTLSWSLRAGVKIHSNDEVADVIHFGLRRNHLDTSRKPLTFLDNSDIEYKIEFDKDEFDIVEQELFINKKWHIGFSEKSVFSFGIGFVLENGKYRGTLAANESDFRLIFRPDLKF